MWPPANCPHTELKSLPKLYFDASVAALHKSNFLAKHSIYAVQTIVILVLTCQDVGPSDLIATLLACAIRIAIHLNIHRFSSDDVWEARRRQSGVDPTGSAGIKQLIDREVRKRLWAALCTEVRSKLCSCRSARGSPYPAIAPGMGLVPLPT